MTWLEDRLRDTFRAAAQSVQADTIRPSPPPPRPARGRIAPVLVPLAAGAAVFAVIAAVALITPRLLTGHRHTGAGTVRTSPAARPPSGSAMPRYFVDLVRPGPLQVRTAATGALVAQDPRFTNATAVAPLTGAGTFLVSQQAATGCSSRLYRVQLTRQGRIGGVTALPTVLDGRVTSLAVSGNGRVIGYALAGCVKGERGYLGVLDPATGHRRQWAAGGTVRGAAIAGEVSVTADGHFLAYQQIDAQDLSPHAPGAEPPGTSSVRLLPTTAPPGPASRWSRTAARFVPGRSGSLVSAVVSADGRTVDACTLRQSGKARVLTLAAYDSATGRRVRVFTTRPTGPDGNGVCALTRDLTGRYLLAPYSLRAGGTSAVLKLAWIDITTGRVGTLTVTTPNGAMSSTVTGMTVAW